MKGWPKEGINWDLRIVYLKSKRERKENGEALRENPNE
jgi:hypothetical protein